MADAIKTLGGRVRYEIHPEEVREAVSAFLETKYGVKIDPEMVKSFDGTKIDQYLVAHATVLHEAKR